MEVVAEIEGQFTIFSDGSVLHLPRQTIPASSHFTDAVASKDVTVNPETGVWARIFMPETADKKRPLLIHFHGGGFISCSSAWVEFHNYFHALCKTAGIIVVSVDYRLAPQYRLPTAYDDCTEAVEWIAKHAAGKAESLEEWLSPAVVDFSRCFLAGDSAGGNIACHVAVRVGEMDVRPLVVKGVVAIHPFLGGEEKTESEGLESLHICDAFWKLALPLGSTKNHPFCNPAVLPLNPGLKLPPVLVAVAGKDEMKDRDLMFYEHLKSLGKEAELMVDENGAHGYQILLPHYEGTPRFIQHIAHYINSRRIFFKLLFIVNNNGSINYRCVG